MSAEELKKEYHSLYEYMAMSQEPEYMKLFGSVMTEMFNWYAANKPDAAEEWLGKLEAIRWDNYLTHKEAERIVADMQPKAPWNLDVWKGAMKSLGLDTEDNPCYNCYALWVAMNMVYSDHGESIANIIGMPLQEIKPEIIVPAVHSLAVDLLCDEDSRFSIRRYFGL